MIPVDQTLFGQGVGNCHAACIASILEIPINSVPNFCAEHGEDEWYAVEAQWLSERGLGTFTIVRNEDFDRLARTFWPGIYWIAGGPTVRGTTHSVVYLGNELIHDPHPSRAGLTRVDWIEFILTANPRAIDGSSRRDARCA